MYTAVKVFSTTKRVEFVAKKEFAIAVLDPEDEIFVVHIMSFHIASVVISDKSKLDLFHKAEIASLQVSETSTTVLLEYSDIADFISLKLTIEFSEQTGINNHAIALVDG